MRARALVAVIGVTSSLSVANHKMTPPNVLGDAGQLHERLAACRSEPLRARVTASLKILDDALRVFGCDAVYASFNGGKDACVVLHLLRAARHAHREKTGAAAPPRAIYFDATDDFDVVRAFVRETCDQLANAGEVIVEPVAPDVGYVDGLTRLVETTRPRPLAFVLGTRTGDPNCGDQRPFEPSSDWMPPFMRVNPILDWSYGDVWAFLREFDLPYCALYDDGYTSLGSVASTNRNPALLDAASETYRPAYLLEDWARERAGRVEKPVKKK